MRSVTLPLVRDAALGLAVALVLAGSAARVRAMPPSSDHSSFPPEQPGGEKSAPSAAQPSSDALKKEFSDVIEGQLAAFRADDYAKAYTFAASPIKGMFAAEDFETMVKTAYPVIAHSSTAEFGLAFDVGDEAVINVRIENAEKKSVLYQYMLHKEDGKWKISGVSEVKSTGLSV